MMCINHEDNICIFLNDHRKNYITWVTLITTTYKQLKDNLLSEECEDMYV